MTLPIVTVNTPKVTERGVPSVEIDRIAMVRIALAQQVDFTVWALRNPALTPTRLLDISTEADAVTQVSLGFGAVGASGRFVHLISRPAGQPVADLAALLLAETQRLGAEVTDNPPLAADLTPAGGLHLDIPLDVDGLIMVHGKPQPAHLRRQGRTWVAHVAVNPTQTVTVLARGVDPADLELAEATDLHPFVVAWEDEQHKRLAAARSEPTDPPVTPATGWSVHVALLESWASNPPPVGTIIDADTGTDAQAALWDAVVARQSRHRRRGPERAAAAVAAMVNQGVHLLHQVSWRDDVVRRSRALAEMAQYTLFSANVPSRRAQEWWDRVWLLSTMPVPSDGLEESERAREWSATHDVWLMAWNRWATGDDAAGRR